MFTRTMRRTLLVAVSILAAAAWLGAAVPCVRAVRIASQGNTIAVVIEADGPLPTPRVGVLGNPPRIYLDFAGVKTTTTGTYPDPNAPVHGVRVAINRADPLVTRVVIDLAAALPHHIDAAQRERGQLTVVVGPVPQATATGAAPPAPPTPDAAPNVPAQPPLSAAPPTATTEPPAPAPKSGPPSNQPAPPADGGAAKRPATGQTAEPPVVAAAVVKPTPPAPSTPVPSRADALSAFASKIRAAEVPAPAKDVEKYLGKAAPVIDRLEGLRSILVSLDAMSAVPDTQLKKAADEFQAIRRALGAIEPPRKLQGIHELLSRACTLGAATTTARADRSTEEATRASTAASAAAGALMLIEHARAALGFVSRSGS